MSILSVFQCSDLKKVSKFFCASPLRIFLPPAETPRFKLTTALALFRYILSHDRISIDFALVRIWENEFRKLNS